MIPFATIQNASIDAPAVITTLVLAVIGLILWAAGRRILRGSFALIGLAFGGVLGIGVGSAFDLGIPAWTIGIVCGIIVACVAAFAYRGVLAAALALILGTAFPLGVWTALDVQQYMARHEAESEPDLASEDDAPIDDNSAASTPRSSDDIDVSWIFEGLRRLGQNPRDAGTSGPNDAAPELAGGASDDPPAVTDETSASDIVNDAIADELTSQSRSKLGDAAEGLGLNRDSVDQSISSASDFLAQLWAGFSDVWADTPPKIQKTLMAACALGVLSGLLLGLSLPGVTAAAVTASGGALLWLTMTIGLLGQVGVPLAGWIPNRPSAWIAIWTLATLIGLLIQWTISRKKSDTSAKRAGG